MKNHTLSCSVFDQLLHCLWAECDMWRLQSIFIGFVFAHTIHILNDILMSYLTNDYADAMFYLCQLASMFELENY